MRGGASDDDITRLIAAAVSRKKKQHAGNHGNLSVMSAVISGCGYCRNVQSVEDEEQANDPHWWVIADVSRTEVM